MKIIVWTECKCFIVIAALHKEIITSNQEYPHFQCLNVMSKVSKYRSNSCSSYEEIVRMHEITIRILADENKDLSFQLHEQQLNQKERDLTCIESKSTQTSEANVNIANNVELEKNEAAIKRLVTENANLVGMLQLKDVEIDRLQLKASNKLKLSQASMQTIVALSERNAKLENEVDSLMLQLDTLKTLVERRQNVNIEKHYSDDDDCIIMLDWIQFSEEINKSLE